MDKRFVILGQACGRQVPPGGADAVFLKKVNQFNFKTLDPYQVEE